MVGGSILAMGLHPVAGHFISEHTLMFDTDKVTDNKRQKVIENGDNNETLLHSNGTEADGSLVGTSSDQNQPQNSGATVDTLGKTVDEEGQFLIPETCSYYGPLNWLTFNVGYHVEHHDFPSIPGSRLHMLSKIAPEFYTNLKHHTSWTYVLWQYITDPKVGPSARVRRPHSLTKDKLI